MFLLTLGAATLYPGLGAFALFRALGIAQSLLGHWGLRNLSVVIGDVVFILSGSYS